MRPRKNKATGFLLEVDTITARRVRAACAGPPRVSITSWIVESLSLPGALPQSDLPRNTPRERLFLELEAAEVFAIDTLLAGQGVFKKRNAFLRACVRRRLAFQGLCLTNA